jgi:putative ABC transport system permease protein
VIWSYLTLVIVSGAVAGLALGVVTARVISWIFTRETGIALSASLGTPEWLLAASLVVIGTVLAMVPAWMIYRRPVIEGLR